MRKIPYILILMAIAWLAPAPAQASCSEWTQRSKVCTSIGCEYTIYYKLCKILYSADMCIDFYIQHECCGTQVNGAYVTTNGCEIGFARPFERLDGTSRLQFVQASSCSVGRGQPRGSTTSTSTL